MRGDDGIVYEIDRQQCITFSSLRTALDKLSALLEATERRFDAATAQVIFLMRVVEQQDAEMEALRKEER